MALQPYTLGVLVNHERALRLFLSQRFEFGDTLQILGTAGGAFETDQRLRSTKRHSRPPTSRTSECGSSAS